MERCVMEHDILREVAVEDLSSVCGGERAIFLPPQPGPTTRPPAPQTAPTKLTDDGNLLGGLNKIECTPIASVQGKPSTGFQCTESLFGRELRTFKLI